jgi:hypothetical protein
MENNNTIPDFSLFGGPLQRLGRRLGLVRDGTNSFRLGLVLGLIAWGVLVVLAILQGVGQKVLSLSMVGIHIRFLVAVPLFFLCETWVAPRMAEFVRNIVRSGVVPEAGYPALTSVVRRIGRLKDPWPAEVVFLAVVFGLPLIEMIFGLSGVPGKTGSLNSLLTESGGRFGPVLGWYLGFCLPLFRFLILRWLWHLGLWCYFLWRVQKLGLRLIPTHPDRTAGLGYLEIVQEHFGALAFAISAVLGASFAEEVASGKMTFETLYLLIPAVVILVAVLFVSPLLIFTPKLWMCRITGWSEYMGMASRYVNQFDQKWIRCDNPSGESVMGTPDLQSLADLTNSVDIVREMRWFPAGRRLLVSLSVCTVIPFLPLVLLKYPVDQLVVQLFKTFTGL